MKLQRAELKLGWKYSAIAFIIAATSVSPQIYQLISSQEFVKSQSKDVANILSQHSNYLAGIDHGTDDTGKNPPVGNT